MQCKKIVVLICCLLIGINSMVSAGHHNARVDDLSDLPTESTITSVEQNWMPMYNLATIITAFAALAVAGYRYRKEIHDTVDRATKKCKSIVECSKKNVSCFLHNHLR